MKGIRWVCLAGACLVAAGFADYPLLAYHFAHADAMPTQWIAVFYSVAMAVSGGSSLLFGRLFDRYGFRVLRDYTTAGSSIVRMGRPTSSGLAATVHERRMIYLWFGADGWTARIEFHDRDAY